MPHDVTAYFKAKAKTIAQRRAKEQQADDTEEAVAANAGPSLTYRNFARSSAKTALDIHDLTHAIFAKRREYLDFNAPIAAMTNKERDDFDRNTEKGLRAYGDAVAKLAERIRKEKLEEQERGHLLAVCEMMGKQLKKAGRVVTEMRKLRVTAVANRSQLSRLSALVEARKSSKKLSPEESENEDSPKPQLRRRLVPESSLPEREPMVPARKDREKDVALFEFSAAEEEPELRPERVQQLSMENEKLFEKFTHVHSTVASLETQIFEIQRLQETFSDKVFDQENVIELINETAVNTTENLRDGNEWIRQAISNSAGRRVIVLFCIVVLSFTLLFLDWYNP